MERFRDAPPRKRLVSLPIVASLVLAFAALALSAGGRADTRAPVKVGILGYGVEAQTKLLERSLERELRLRPERPSLTYRIAGWAIRYTDEAADEGIEKLRAFRPDIILLTSPILVDKVQARIEKVPLVVHGQGQMSKLPFFDSVARPGGRATGFVREPVSAAKQVELLQGFCRSITRVGVLASAELRTDDIFVEYIAAENERLRRGGAVIVPLFTQGMDLLPSLPAIVAAQRLDGLLIQFSNDVRDRLDEVVAAMRSLRIPHVYTSVDAVERGAALAAQPAPYDIAMTGAEYISRIAHGEPPGEIPVQIRRAYDIAVHTQRIKDFNGCDPRRIAKIATRFHP